MYMRNGVVSNLNIEDAIQQLIDYADERRNVEYDRIGLAREMLEKICERCEKRHAYYSDQNAYATADMYAALIHDIKADLRILS